MKKLEKMSLANVKNKLTRKEMGNIIAGSGWSIFCISGVLDGIHGNTQFHFGRCR